MKLKIKLIGSQEVAQSARITHNKMDITNLNHHHSYCTDMKQIKFIVATLLSKTFGLVRPTTRISLAFSSFSATCCCPPHHNTITTRQCMAYTCGCCFVFIDVAICWFCVFSYILICFL
jgi:hypothetical protein